jgi:hypothetical protein
MNASDVSASIQIQIIAALRAAHEKRTPQVLGWFVGKGGRKCAAAVAYEAIFEEPFPQDYTMTAQFRLRDAIGVNMLADLCRTNNQTLGDRQRTFVEMADFLELQWNPA